MINFRPKATKQLYKSISRKGKIIIGKYKMSFKFLLTTYLLDRALWLSQKFDLGRGE